MGAKLHQTPPSRNAIEQAINSNPQIHEKELRKFIDKLKEHKRLAKSNNNTEELRKIYALEEKISLILKAIRSGRKYIFREARTQTGQVIPSNHLRITSSVEVISLPYTFKNPNKISHQESNAFMNANHPNKVDRVATHQYLINIGVLSGTVSDLRGSINYSKFINNQAAEKFEKWIESFHNQDRITAANLHKVTEKKEALQLNSQQKNQLTSVIESADKISKDLSKKDWNELVGELDKDTHIATSIYVEMARRIGKEGMYVKNSNGKNSLELIDPKKSSILSLHQKILLAGVLVRDLLDLNNIQAIQAKKVKSKNELVYLHLMKNHSGIVEQQQTTAQSEKAAIDYATNPDDPKNKEAMEQIVSHKNKNGSSLLDIFDPKKSWKEKMDIISESSLGAVGFIIAILYAGYKMVGNKWGILGGVVALVAGAADGITFKEIAKKIGGSIDESSKGSTSNNSIERHPTFKKGAERVSSWLDDAGNYISEIFSSDTSKISDYNDIIKNNPKTKDKFIAKKPLDALNNFLLSDKTFATENKDDILKINSFSDLVVHISDSTKQKLNEVLGNDVNNKDTIIKNYLNLLKNTVYKNSDSIGIRWSEKIKKLAEKAKATVAGGVSTSLTTASNTMKETLSSYSENPHIKKIITRRISNLKNTGDDSVKKEAADALKRAILSNNIENFKITDYNLKEESTKKEFTELINIVVFGKSQETKKNETLKAIADITLINDTKGEEETNKTITYKIKKLEKIYSDYQNSYNSAQLGSIIAQNSDIMKYYKNSITPKYESKKLELIEKAAFLGVEPYKTNLAEIKKQKAENDKKAKSKKEVVKLQEALSKIGELPTKQKAPKEFVNFLDNNSELFTSAEKIINNVKASKELKTVARSILKKKDNFVKNYKAKVEAHNNSISAIKEKINNVGNEEAQTITSKKRELEKIAKELYIIETGNKDSNISKILNWVSDTYRSISGDNQNRTTSPDNLLKQIATTLSLGNETHIKTTSSLGIAIYQKRSTLEALYTVPQISTSIDVTKNLDSTLKSIEESSEILEDFLHPEDKKKELKEQVNNLVLAFVNSIKKGNKVQISALRNDYTQIIEDRLGATFGFIGKDLIENDTAVEDAYEERLKEIKLNEALEEFSVNKSMIENFSFYKNIKNLPEVKKIIEGIFPISGKDMHNILKIWKQNPKFKKYRPLINETIIFLETTVTK